MSNPTLKKARYWCLLSLLPLTCMAEGIVDIKPYISAGVNYDDNIFRFSSPAQAKAALGSSDASDVMKRLELGVLVNLRLSRQLISLSSSLSENKFNRFDYLDNRGKSNSLRWDWRLGSNFYGELSASEDEAIAGFNETRSAVKNLRTVDRQFASINWNFKPDWTIYVSREQVKLDNESASSRVLNREDEIVEGGVRFQSPLNTQLGLAYRVADSTFPNRAGPVKLVFGDASSQKEAIVTAAWLPGPKTRISTRLSHVNLKRNISSGRDFSGFSQRLGLDYQASDKINLNLAAYQVVSPVDDVVSTYVKSKGVDISPTWNISSKVSLSGNLGYSENTYLGSAGISINSEERLDESTQAGLTLLYTPTQKSLVQLQYQGEKRTSNIVNTDYEFNNINFLVRYSF
jgi:exopolysaccharide biosynthesis operon protein EpsL